MAKNVSKKKKVCPSCEAQNRLSANFCIACGCLLAEDTVYSGRISNYRIVEKQPFAYGRVSILLKASNNSGEYVAVKAFRSLPVTNNRDAYKDVVDEFDQQVFAQYSLKHPGILSVLDYGHKKELSGNVYPFLVLPFCVGGNLKQVIQSKSFIGVESSLFILEQIALAIDHAHKNGFVHGDIKPENILFPQKDVLSACLTDFGLAKYFPYSEQITTMHAGGGSIIYLSPEQVEKNKQSPASDIFSFAVVAYEMITGNLPYDLSLPAYALLQAKVTGIMIDPREHNEKIPQTVRMALLKGLSVEPKNRPHTAIEFCQMLKGEVPIGAGKNRPPWGWWNTLPSAHKIELVIAILAALAAIIAAVIQIIPNLLK